MFAPTNNGGMTQLPAGDWITVAEAADLLEISKRRVQKLIEEERLKATRMTPRLYLLLREDVLAFAKEDRPPGRPTDKKKSRKQARGGK